MEAITNAPVCKTVICKKPLTWLDDSKCWRCLICNPLPRESDAPDQEAHRYVDVKPDEKRVKEMINESLSADKIREIIQDELASWHIQRPAVTRDEIEEMIKTNNASFRVKVKPETWRQKAQRLGVELHNRTEEGKPMGVRKKEDVMADIEAVEKEKSAEADDNAHPQG